MLLDVILFPSSLLSSHCLTTEQGGGREQRGARNFLRAWAHDARLGKRVIALRALPLPLHRIEVVAKTFRKSSPLSPEKLFPFTDRSSVQRSNFPWRTRKGFEPGEGAGGGGGGGCGETDLSSSVRFDSVLRVLEIRRDTVVIVFLFFFFPSSLLSIITVSTIPRRHRARDRCVYEGTSEWKE